MKESDGNLTGDLNGYDVMFTHYQNEEFDGVLTMMGVNFPLIFESDENGNVSGFSAVLEPTVAPIVFKRIE